MQDKACKTMHTTEYKTRRKMQDKIQYKMQFKIQYKIEYKIQERQYSPCNITNTIHPIQYNTYRRKDSTNYNPKGNTYNTLHKIQSIPYNPYNEIHMIQFLQHIAYHAVQLYWVCVARLWPWGGYRGGFCEKLLEASPLSDRANASRLQDGHAAGQGRAQQRRW